MHLEDYSTEPNEIELYCGRHIPKDRSNGYLWLCEKPRRKWFIRALTDNAKAHAEGNLPNTIEDYNAVEKFGKIVANSEGGRP